MSELVVRDPTTSTTSTDKDDERIAGLSKGVSCTCSVIGLSFCIGLKMYKHKKNQKVEQE
ncbi:hypothetical protein K504DRAFT_297071 [Pleomassaria siparia CBS 279.74]|uniref:Uncharacterized protein n=1 Tax=Pleomassaria siparia CBS 279.74 TaxID=1314801 RepID=A0A6G1K5C5_9PLEO|nr:hypothetical protein K504DRAFT_297071 [Pleomassaria siparia CBS 279.74]